LKQLHCDYNRIVT